MEVNFNLYLVFLSEGRRLRKAELRIRRPPEVMGKLSSFSFFLQILPNFHNLHIGYSLLVAN